MRHGVSSSGGPDAGYFFFLRLAWTWALDLVFAMLRKPGRSAASVGFVKIDGGAVVERVAGVVAVAAAGVASVSSDIAAV